MVLLLLVSLPINIIFHKVKLPSVMGFIVAGVVIGPYGLKLVDDVESVNHLAEIGVILLLFVVGLEFSISRLIKNFIPLLAAGGAQLTFTGLAIYGILSYYGVPQNQSILLSALGAISSTAIVMKMITDRAELETLHGQTCIGILLVQDLAVVPLILMIPLLAGTAEGGSSSVGMAFLISVVAVTALVVVSRLLVPKALSWVARYGSSEHLTLLVILIILGAGLASESLGLSLAMGAFIAGIIISDSEYSHQIFLDILPLRDYFSAIFFISIGMLLNLSIFIESGTLIFTLLAALVVVKIAGAFLSAVVTKNSSRISFVVGLRLAQAGEFSLVLAKIALDEGIFEASQYQIFLIVSTLSMLIAPLLIQGSSKWSLRLFGAGDETAEGPKKSSGSLKDHVIVVGYGHGGQNLSKVLNEIQIPFQIIELDGESVRRALIENFKVLYGDSTRANILVQAGIMRAKAIVFAISDFQATEQGIKLSRKLNPDIHILVRTRFAREVEELTNAGADQVIAEEFETSIEIFSRVLREFKIPSNVIEQQIELVRMEGYGMFRGISLDAENLRKFSTYLTATLTESYQVSGECWANGKTVEALHLKALSGAQLIAVVRGNEVTADPDAAFSVVAGDVLVLFGRHASLVKARKIIEIGDGACEKS
ncbi:MAG: potassium transporter Kef [Candidatus Nitrohelix vancouverensis]|uniref:Potassium transporter Kef n=1 Tax=Candidatus Nitrohelix vancouverensis TaxID=2705534 RepID=A0A7T0C5Y4_9BACT|nr:MAG: potassium transporter Kef [Candidatus Nitrohelix vancouverensis]